jgi:hypothetical protein
MEVVFVLRPACCWVVVGVGWLEGSRHRFEVAMSAPAWCATVSRMCDGVQVDVLDVDDSAVNMSRFIDVDVLRSLVEQQKTAHTSAAAMKRAQKRQPVRHTVLRTMNSARCCGCCRCVLSA